VPRDLHRGAAVGDSVLARHFDVVAKSTNAPNMAMRETCPSTRSPTRCWPLDPARIRLQNHQDQPGHGRRIGLSYKAAVKQVERREIEQYRTSKTSASATIGDALKQKLASRG